MPADEPRTSSAPSESDDEVTEQTPGSASAVEPTNSIRRFGRKIRKHRVNLVLFCLATALAIALAWGYLGPNRALLLGEPGESGPVAFSVTSLKCQVTVDDLPPGMKQDHLDAMEEDPENANSGPLLIDFAQGCLLSVNIRNNSNTLIDASDLYPSLHVDDEIYFPDVSESVGGTYLRLFPGQSGNVAFLTLIPPTVSPNFATFSWFGEDEVRVNL